MSSGNSINYSHLRPQARTNRSAVPGHRAPSARSVLALCASIVTAAFITLAGCERTDSVDEEKSRTLSADERYLVELYLKINDLEKNLKNNPGDSLKKWDELRASVDSTRVRHALDALAQDPEGWVGVYSRINELLSPRR